MLLRSGTVVARSDWRAVIRADTDLIAVEVFGNLYKGDRVRGDLRHIRRSTLINVSTGQTCEVDVQDLHCSVPSAKQFLRGL